MCKVKRSTTAKKAARGVSMRRRIAWEREAAIKRIERSRKAEGK